MTRAGPVTTVQHTFVVEEPHTILAPVYKFRRRPAAPVFMKLYADIE